MEESRNWYIDILSILETFGHTGLKKSSVFYLFKEIKLLKGTKMSQQDLNTVLAMPAVKQKKKHLLMHSSALL